MYLRSAGRKEGVDLYLTRLYNVATIISAKTFITSVRDNSKYYCLFLKCIKLIVNSVFLRPWNMNYIYIMYQNMPKCPKRSKYAFICKIKTDYLLLERLN
jgi:hypothetical protein